MRSWVAWILVGAWLIAVPITAAQSDDDREDSCLAPDVSGVCDAAINASFHRFFPGFADLMFVIAMDAAIASAVVGTAFVALQLRPLPTLRLETAERVREVEPGGTVRFRFDLENLRATLPAEVLVERPDLPGNWRATISGHVTLDGGFRVPMNLENGTSIPLSSRRRGSHRAQLDLVVEAPGDTAFEETLEYSLRVVPVLKGKVQDALARTSKVTVLVSSNAPQIEILDVVHDPSAIAPGVPVKSTVRVRNRGAAAAEDVAVVLFLNGQAVDRADVSGLDASTERSVEFDWTPAAGENKIRVAVE